jgi:hypothetical protein
MSCWRVTLTGADDLVDPDDLYVIGEKYPMVEWGFLLSDNKVGTPRYPSWGQLMKFLSWGYPSMSLHLCGRLAKDALFEPRRTHIVPDGRVQINGYTPDSIPFPTRIYNHPVILQVSTIPALKSAENLILVYGGDDSTNPFRILWDISGGKGIPIDTVTLPEFRYPNLTGYAGGITPENVTSILTGILKDSPPTWIDMETGIRDSSNNFSLDRCIEVLDKVASHG